MRSYRELADHEMDLWIKVEFLMTNIWMGLGTFFLEYFN